MGVVVLAIVLALLAVAVSGRGREWLGGRKAIVIGGFAFPVIVLSALLIYGLTTTARVLDPPAAGERRIRVSGELWWWRITYYDGDRPAFETANEIRIPAGEPVTLELVSADVIHSIWIPRLGPKLDMIPGRMNVLRLQADAPGVYRGQCTEYCGAAHALMALEVVAMEPAAFDAWMAAQAAPAAASGGRGAELFDSAGCGACHAVRGANANGALGPDLTHFASRRTLGAGILANEPTMLRLWIADADELKPGVRMPQYAALPPEDREALALYLESLR
ncbi:MAG TPA: c-type cytochrome [Vitreimonas sp.]|uniref:c-type cytochrome n=1 Tax=Vitreimonas sp. TaxID=3069702 RepID=UPI002D47C152|nr:c-type cytochrome [Vitreimonas sp.]HYD87179.1 c-type cytochrome [Vitreimonas sp.]